MMLIRVAMLTGVLIFGGVAWFIRRGAPPDFDPAGLNTLLWGARAVWGASMAACLVLFLALRNARQAQQVRTLSLIGWAAGEAVPLMGGVIWLLTGNSRWYSLGLVYLVLTFLAFPAPRE
ncbi:MAG TPA: hypothetical protein VFV33_02810 [Gemmatimonadaceae bacterium]|nr:hypothetical protein [Gemmatimonadaceae bacterium]